MPSHSVLLSVIPALLVQAYGLGPSPSRNKRFFTQGKSRRQFASQLSIPVLASFPAAFPSAPANASAENDRSEGYADRLSEEEWRAKLTPRQYEILRAGGTEQPYTSVLEGEERSGRYFCAACENRLFASDQKFHSGTGWPSFAAAEKGVEVSRAGLGGGSEIRCAKCGGHLGDVFNDGWLYPGTPAFSTGKRFCVDGASLVFRPKDGKEVIGDTQPGGLSTAVGIVEIVARSIFLPVVGVRALGSLGRLGKGGN